MVFIIKIINGTEMMNNNKQVDIFMKSRYGAFFQLLINNIQAIFTCYMDCIWGRGESKAITKTHKFLYASCEKLLL